MQNIEIDNLRKAHYLEIKINIFNVHRDKDLNFNSLIFECFIAVCTGLYAFVWNQ